MLRKTLNFFSYSIVMHRGFTDKDVEIVDKLNSLEN